MLLSRRHATIDFSPSRQQCRKTLSLPPPWTHCIYLIKEQCLLKKNWRLTKQLLHKKRLRDDTERDRDTVAKGTPTTSDTSYCNGEGLVSRSACPGAQGKKSLKWQLEYKGTSLRPLPFGRGAAGTLSGLEGLVSTTVYVSSLPW